ncbi:hypothetical protein BBK82_11885 [Lentzea guizhouensis]|uniref:Uncharacterized protein n=1 Tax=Lentzea guizhouensis TaxID=1586287 RepID=A0A1B2HG20_9PSEU|nr:hypothetical protein [Lentzea guizhouensis]ANZ36662.1 hypothetical protein BBK82_11885 [Lentzea guizhouensis]
MDPRRLRSILDDHPETAHLLAVFEFDVSRGADGSEFELSSGEALHTVAGTFAGDTYLVCGAPQDDRPVAYATSEGQAGLIARNLKEALELVVLLPCWQDCLTFSGDGDLAAMTTVAEHSLRKLAAENPQLEAQQKQVVEVLSLDHVDTATLLTRLHHAVSSTWPDHVISDENGEYESLFGAFTPDRNPEGDG